METANTKNSVKWKGFFYRCERFEKRSETLFSVSLLHHLFLFRWSINILQCEKTMPRCTLLSNNNIVNVAMLNVNQAFRQALLLNGVC